MNVIFQYPYLLLLLFLIPVFIAVYFLGMAYNKKKAIVFSNFEALARISDVELFSKGFFSLYISIAIVALLVFSVVGTTVSFETETSSFAYVILIDNSPSMVTSDVIPTRINAARDYARDFVNILPLGSPIGVVEFSGDVNVLQSVDGSKIKAKMALESVEISAVEGENIYNAVITADRLLKGKDKKSVLLISDGRLGYDEKEAVADYAVKNNLVINAILVGQEDSAGENSLAADESVLSYLVLSTEGQMFKNNEEGVLNRPLADILRKSQGEVLIDISFYLMIIALVLLLVNWVFYNFRFKSIP